MSAAGHLAAGCRLAGALTRAGTPARSLKIQSTIAATSEPGAEEEKEKFSSALPLLPAMTEDTLDDYRAVYAIAVSLLILFGGLVAPVLEVKLGIGGASYADVIEKLHLPGQLAQVDRVRAAEPGVARARLAAAQGAGGGAVRPPLRGVLRVQTSWLRVSLHMDSACL